jgi:pimeloyl-ACP methyl ester carboxylesterase
MCGSTVVPVILDSMMWRIGFIIPSVLLLFLVAGPASAEPGTIIGAQKDEEFTPEAIADRLPALFEGVAAPTPRHAVDVYLLDYETTGLDGAATQTRVQLFVPRLTEPLTVPLYVFAPGSTGLVDECRPSREHIIGVNWGLYRTHALAHAGRGSIVAIPDYMSFQVEGKVQPYFVSMAESRVLLDAVRAVRTFMVESDYLALPYDGAFLAGYSQGGHAVFSAADFRADYAPDVEIAGIIGYGPSTDVENLFREWTVAAPLVVYSYATVYGRDLFDPGLILRERWHENLMRDVTSQCIGAIQRYYPTEPRRLYRAEFADALLGGTLARDYPDIARLMALNDAGLTGHGIAALILSGTDDIVVYPDSMRRFVAALCREGSPVEHIVYHARHDTRQIGFQDAVDWMWRRMAGEPPPSDCGG